MTNPRKSVALFCLLATIFGGASQPAAQQSATKATRATVPIENFYDLLDDSESRALAAFGRIREGWRDAYAGPLLELVGAISSRATRIEVVKQLEQVTGQPFAGNLDPWYEWLWSRELGEHPDYAELKARLYEPVDPRFREYFARDRKAIIRLDEIRWGGVRRDGIPPLKNPKMLAAKDVTYLGADDIVFGVAIDGDVRAYPKRILAWHEMVKDRIGGRELNGVYCTLCGAMVLYEASIGGVHYELGTSGFLYRSNKLMYDHATKSLWSTLTGTPVVGPLVGQGIELKPLHVVTTTWGAWRKQHPGTTVLSLDTGHQRDYAEGVAYREYFATDRLMFGIPKLDDRLLNKAEVLALRGAGKGAAQLAIAADFLQRNPIYQDRLDGQPFVVLTDASGANRVYASGNRQFESWDGERTARDRDGRTWTVSEDALSGPGGVTLKRMAAHRAFWFGWYAAYPRTRLVK